VLKAETGRKKMRATAKIEENRHSVRSIVTNKAINI
jgi:hypothetical protein